MADQSPTIGEKTLANEVRGIVERATPTANPKRVVRTYAMDVANLTGAPAPAPAPTTTLPSIPVPTPKLEPRPIGAPPKPPNVSLSDVVSKIKLPEVASETPHLPPLSKRGVPKTEMPRTLPKRPTPKSQEESGEWERLVEKKEPSFIAKLFSFIFSTGSETPAIKNYIPAPTPVWQKPREPEDTRPSAPSFKPAEVVADEGREREAVLARLRSRVETYQATQPVAPPVYPTPRPEYQAPVRSAYLPPQVPTQAAEPERLRTYTDDFSSRIDTQQASAFSVYAAQADSAQGATPAPAQKKQSMGLAYALGGAILIIGGSLVLYYGYTFFAGNQPIAVVNTAPATIISGDDQATLSGTDGALMAKLAGAANVSLPIGNVRILYLAATATSTESGGALIKALQLPAPDILLRNIGDTSTVGVVHAGDETRVFFVLAATSYERTFAGMLSWEATLAKDLVQLYPTYPAPVIPTPPVATTTTKIGKTTAPEPISTAIPVKPHFVDEVVDSHDVRAFKDSEGRTVLLYGYRDQNTLLIARDEITFSVLLARLSATRTQ